MSGSTASWFLGMVMGSALGSVIAFYPNCAYAQSNIVSDNTLGAENSTVIPNYNGQPIEVISGGAQRGQNLFHSLQEFNVSNGRGAYFFSPGANIQNILARVTGGNRSEILGTLGTFGNSNPNLFLINPNGIIFGRNARLNVGGSFVATTANAIRFSNQGFFSATNPNTPELLTVNPSAFFFNQIAAAPIQNNSFTYGLRVPDGRSLLLVGGNIKMDGGRLGASGGRVELGGLAGAGTVGLNGDGNNLSLSFPNSVERSDVSLINGASVTVIAGDGGSIAVNTRNLEMTGGSFLLAGIGRGLGSDNSKAGNIDVNATVAINLNNDSSIDNQVLARASGQGGDVSISASTLQVEGGAQVGTATDGVGKGGNLTVNATDSVQVIGRSTDGRFSSNLSTGANLNATGAAGNLTINTRQLLVQDGSQISAGTFGAGKGGNLTVNATDSVQVIGRSTDGRVGSNLSTKTEANTTGAAGNLMINTRQLLVRNGAFVSAGTSGAGKGGNLTVNATDSVQVIGRSTDGRFSSNLSTGANLNATGAAGNLTINTRELLVRNGAQVSTSTFGAGKGGDLTVNATDSVQVIGGSTDGRVGSSLSAQANLNAIGDAGNLMINTRQLLVRDGSQISAGTDGAGKGGNLTVNAQDVQLLGRSADDEFPSGLSTSAQSNSTGDAGDLTIKTNTLLVQNGAGVGVRSFGTGTSGNMTVNARSIRLDNDALLTANTQSAKVDPNREQATININSRDLIMRHGSNIRTNATGENVIGGNINIDTDFLIAAENSDISANSENFRGGNVTIKAQGIFGTQFRDVPSDKTSDITATGVSREFSGNVELNVPDVDLNSGLINLPSVPLDTKLAQGCYSPGYAQSSFIITGRGGLPPNPKDVLSPDAVEVDWVTLDPDTDNRKIPSVSTFLTNPTPERIVEATGWVFNAKGQVEFIADAPSVTPNGSWQNPVSCRASG